MPRYCLLGHVDPNRLDEYREVHRAVWPELLEALRDAGWRNYSLFPDRRYTRSQLHRYADEGVRVFLAGYTRQ